MSSCISGGTTMRKRPSPSLEEFAVSAEAADALRAANRRLQSQLATAKERLEDLVAATLQGARDAYLSLPARVPLPTPSAGPAKGKPEGAIWHLTDWQGGKLTPSYSMDVLRSRVTTYWRKAARITEIQRAAHPVRQCLVMFGGDMIEGLFQFPRQPFEIDASLFGQWAAVSRLCIETVEAALAIYPEVRVIGEWGNHGRIGSKRDAVPRADNLDRMAYEHARQMLAARERLIWQDCPEDIQRIKMGNYRALLIHGDEAGRHGYVSAQTMVQHVNRWRSGAYPWPFRDVYVGHYHRHAEEPLANGEGAVYWTGSTESDNRYAREQSAASARPSQRLHFVDLEEGRVSAQYKIHL